MIVRIHRRGRSFKGATAYVMHDKDKAKTSERVAWTATGNLSTNDPLKAAHIMAWTDKNRDCIRAAWRDANGMEPNAAGTKPHAGNVLHETLSWALSENPTEQHMRETARSYLNAAGRAEHQYVMAAHTDTAHIHLHIISNAVHPTTGLVADLGWKQRGAQAWALGYERDHGIHCRMREENALRREQGETVKYRAEKQDYAQAVSCAYSQSDNGAAFVHALKEQGLTLCAARRGAGFVLVDKDGNIQKLARQLQMEEKHKAKTEAINAKLADLDRAALPDADALSKEIKAGLGRQQDAAKVDRYREEQEAAQKAAAGAQKAKAEEAGAKQKKVQAAPANDRQPQAGKPDREAALLAARDAAAAQLSKAGGFWSRLFRRREFETACTRQQEAEQALSDYRAGEAQNRTAGQLERQARLLQEENRLAEEKAQAAAAAREKIEEENKGFFRRGRSLLVAAIMADIENAKAAARRDVLDRGPEFWGQVAKELDAEEQEITAFYHVDAIRADLQEAQLSLRRAGRARSAGPEQAERIAGLQRTLKNAETREAEALARVRAERTAIEKALEERQAQRHAAKAPQPEDQPEAGQGIGRLREEYRRTLREPGTGQESQPPTGEQQQPGGGIGTLRQDRPTEAPPDPMAALGPMRKDLPRTPAPEPAQGIGTLREEYRQQLAEHQERQQTAGEASGPDAGESQTPDASQHVDLD